MERPVQMRWLSAGAYGAAGAVATVLVLGIPTDVVANPWFTRMTPVRPQDYLFLGLNALLTGLLAASYAFPATCPLGQGKLTAGGLLAFLAIGCPICNKVVVLLLGVSGALTYFAPIQPVLGTTSAIVLAVAVWLRGRGIARTPRATGNPAL